MADGLPPVRMGPGAFLRNNGGEKPRDFKGTIKQLWRITKDSRKGLRIVLFLSICSSGSAIFSPYIIGRAVSMIEANDPTSPMVPLPQSLMGQGIWAFLLTPFAVLLLLYLTDWLVRFLQQFMMTSISQRMILSIRRSLFAHMKRLPLSFFDTHQHGELMSRLTNDIDTISTSISESLAQLMIYAFTIVGVLTIMLSSNILLTAVCCCSIVLVFALTKMITSRSRKLYKKQQEDLGKLNAQVEESISGAQIVKAFGQEAEMIAEFERTNAEYCDAATKAITLSGYLMPMMNVINNFSYLSLAIVAGILCATGQISLGVVTTFLLYSRQFTRPFVDTANIYNNFQSAVAGAERVFEILQTEQETPDGADAISLTDPKGEIVLKDVSFSYLPDKPILSNINQTIRPGTRVAIVGETGAGKTTIINLMTRLYDVTQGAIYLDGHDLREYKREDLRRAFGVVLQDTALFEGSLRENIIYGKPDASEEEVVAAAKACGADAFIRRLPNGYDTVIESGDELSQGERQLITIARAVLVNAPILILDEATSSVDTLTERRIKDAVLRLTQDRTCFMIAHRLSTIRESDCILVLDRGKVLEQGTHEELVQLGGKYAALYRTQTKYG
ncbi:MAG: ABC transporter ATP-binding protein/permease [Clostridium sp.]|nr:ABC transporter ATP-binding protein/permease [Clostridium sp.]